MTEKKTKVKTKKAVKAKVVKALKQKQPKGCTVTAVIDGDQYTYTQAEEAYASIMGDLMWLLQRGEALERALETWPTECPCCGAKEVRS